MLGVHTHQDLSTSQCRWICVREQGLGVSQQMRKLGGPLATVGRGVATERSTSAFACAWVALSAT